MNDPRKLLERILKTARKYEVSDIHLIVGIPPAFRICGDIHLAQECEPMSREDLLGLTAMLLNDLQKDKLERERELSIAYFDEYYGRIRLSMYHRIGCPEMSIRMCNTAVKSAAELMLPDVFGRLTEHTSGLVIITGPTGVGKTTTLNYMIDLINASRRCKIITIEDPVEFVHAHRKSIVTQIEVGTDTNNFASCLRNVLRLDPDVICVGEMRDLETIETALTAAETGHLVIATLHTPNALSTVERIIGSFKGDRQSQVITQLASCLQAVVAQRLIPAVERNRRVLATEVLIANTGTRSVIRENRLAQLPQVIVSGRKEGMHMLEDSLSNLYLGGQITYDQALLHAVNHDLLKSLVEKA